MHISPYYPVTNDVCIPEECGLTPTQTTWVFKMDILVGVIVKLIIVYVISCMIINNLKRRNK